MTVPIHFASVIQHAWKQQDRISIAAARRSGKTQGLLGIMKDLAYKHLTTTKTGTGKAATFLFLTHGFRIACDLSQVFCDMLNRDNRFAAVTKYFLENRQWLVLDTPFSERHVNICFYRDLPRLRNYDSWNASSEKYWYGDPQFTIDGATIQAVFVDEPGLMDPKAIERLTSEETTWKLLFAGTPGDNEEHEARWKLPQHFEFSMVQYTSTKQVEAIFTPPPPSESSSSSSSCTEHEQ